MRNYKAKALILASSALMLISLSGCKNPTDENGAVKLITTSTTFKEVFQEDSWFQGLLVYPMSQAMNKLTPVVGAFAAIAIVTIIAQVAIFLITRKSTIATQRMQMIQPEIDRIQKKYEGKKDEASQMRQAQELQAIYKKYDINPLGSILTMFIQFPLIIAIYLSVQRSDAVVNGSVLGLSLSQSPLEGIKAGQYLYILLFVVMIVCQFASMMLPQYLAKQKALKEGKKAPAQNQMMQSMYMSMGLIFLLSIMWPSAMLTYWIISSIVNIVKTLLVQKLITNDGAKVQRG